MATVKWKGREICGLHNERSETEPNYQRIKRECALGTHRGKQNHSVPPYLPTLSQQQEHYLPVLTVAQLHAQKIIQRGFSSVRKLTCKMKNVRGSTKNWNQKTPSQLDRSPEALLTSGVFLEQLAMPPPLSVWLVPKIQHTLHSYKAGCLHFLS